MIPILLRDLRWRLLLLLLVCVTLYFLEPAFHRHEETVDPEFAQELGPLGISATLAYLAGLSMIVLLAGFVSTDRREGHTRLYFSHPTSPLTFYGLRWAIAFGVTLVTVFFFLVFGQLLAWGRFMGGASGILLAAVAAVVYGGLMAFLSTALRRGDAWVAFLLFLPTFFPQILSLVELGISQSVYRGILFLLPPHGALQDIYQGLLQQAMGWSAVAFAVGYGVFWLLLAGLLLRVREWP